MSKKIRLTNSRRSAFVDKETYHFLKRFRWYLHSSSGYAVTMVWFFEKRRHLSMHQLLMAPFASIEHEVDHINRDKLDNRVQNLRIASKRLNRINRGLQTNSTTGYKGVSYLKKNKTYMAYIGSKKATGNGRIYLGCYKTAAAAAAGYNRMAKKIYGKDAVLNDLRKR